MAFQDGSVRVMFHPSNQPSVGALLCFQKGFLVIVIWLLNYLFGHDLEVESQTSIWFCIKAWPASRGQPIVQLINFSDSFYGLWAFKGSAHASRLKSFTLTQIGGNWEEEEKVKTQLEFPFSIEITVGRNSGKQMRVALSFTTAPPRNQRGCSLSTSLHLADTVSILMWQVSHFGIEK